MRRPLEFLRYMFGSRSLIGKTFENVVDRVVTRPDVRALVAMITEGTCSAGPGEVDAAYMVRAMAEMWSPGTQLQYPKVRPQACSLVLEKERLFLLGGGQVTSSCSCTLAHDVCLS